MMESKLRFVPAFLGAMSILLPCAACNSKQGDDPSTAESAVPLEPGETGEQPAHAKRKRALPPAAFEACQGKGVGDACSVTLAEKQISAKCAATPDGRLACRPEHAEREKPPE